MCARVVDSLDQVRTELLEAKYCVSFSFLATLLACIIKSVMTGVLNNIKAFSFLLVWNFSCRLGVLKLSLKITVSYML